MAADPPHRNALSQTVAEVRAMERRAIPFEVSLKASEKYDAGGPVEVTVVITNLFPKPLLMNARMLVNHARLAGEVSFLIVGPDGKPVHIQSLVTPLTIRDEDFVVLEKGESIQRSVNLSDIYGVKRKGVYKLRVSYHNEVDFVASAKRAWKGIVWSDPVEIHLQ